MISVLRDGSGFVPKADTVVEAGDEVLVVLDPGLEETSRASSSARTAVADARVLIVGAGAAGAACAEALRGRRLRRLGGARGARRRPALRAARSARRTTCGRRVARADLPRAAGRARPADPHERHEARHRGPRGQAAGEELSFGQAVLATGANVRRLRVDGAELEGIHYLRALGNADAIRADAEDAERVVLVGGSYIACEVAASLTAQGRACTLVMQEAGPLSPASGHGGRVLRRRPARPRDRLGRQRRAGALRGRRPRPAGGHRVGPRRRGGSRRHGHRRHPGRHARPPAGLDSARRAASPARRCWRPRRRGSGRRATCASTTRSSTAAGCASSTGRSRVPRAPRSRAHHRLARAVREIPYFWSDLADWCTLEYVGPAASWDEEVVRGSIEDGSSRSSTSPMAASPPRSRSAVPMISTARAS